MINDITVIGANLPAHFVEPNLTSVTGTTHSLDFRPIGATRVVKNSTQLSEVDSDEGTSIGSTEFKIDVENKTIKFGTALVSGDNVQIEYDREPANMISRKKNDASKTQYGTFAKILNVPVMGSFAKFDMFQDETFDPDKILQDKDKAFFFTYKDINDNNKNPDLFN